MSNTVMNTEPKHLKIAQLFLSLALLIVGCLLLLETSRISADLKLLETSRISADLKEIKREVTSGRLGVSVIGQPRFGLLGADPVEVRIVR